MWPGPRQDCIALRDYWSRYVAFRPIREWPHADLLFEITRSPGCYAPPDISDLNLERRANGRALEEFCPRATTRCRDCCALRQISDKARARTHNWRQLEPCLLAARKHSRD